jgi:hypothetical protein
LEWHCPTCNGDGFVNLDDEFQLRMLQTHMKKCVKHKNNDRIRCFSCGIGLTDDTYVSHLKKCCIICNSEHKNGECEGPIQAPTEYRDYINKNPFPVDTEVTIPVKKDSKKEAVIPNSPKYKTETIMQYAGSVLLADKTRIADCLFVLGPSGQQCIFMNSHVVAMKPKYVRANGKDFELHTKDGELTRAKFSFKKYKHTDLTLLAPLDGLSYMPKKYWAVGAANQNAAVVNVNWKLIDGKPEKCIVVSPGTIKGHLPLDGQPSLEYKIKTEKGDCGGVVIDENGKVLAIHYSAGKVNETNMGIAVTQVFLEEWETAANHPKN